MFGRSGRGVERAKRHQARRTLPRSTSYTYASRLPPLTPQCRPFFPSYAPQKIRCRGIDRGFSIQKIESLLVVLRDADAVSRRPQAVQEPTTSAAIHAGAHEKRINRSPDMSGEHPPLTPQCPASKSYDRRFCLPSPTNSLAFPFALARLKRAQQPQLKCLSA